MDLTSTWPRNRLLLALPPRSLKQVIPDLKHIECKREQVLLDADSPLDHVYFPDSGVVSVVAVYPRRPVIATASLHVVRRRCGPFRQGGLMKARIMLDSAPFGPDDLEIARQAFDSAWTAIAARYDASSADAARERLAKLDLSLISDTKDPAEIQAIAVQEMTKGD